MSICTCPAGQPTEKWTCPTGFWTCPGTFVRPCRWLSLSRSPGDKTKYFELSVVWDSQLVASFTLYMYTDCLDHHDYNLHVHVFGNDILEFKYPLTDLLIPHSNFEKPATEIKECWWLLTSKNAVKQCSITKVTKAPLRTHLTAWLCWMLA